MASRVQFMSVCRQRGETAPWDETGASGDAGREGERGQGRETGGRGTGRRETGRRETGRRDTGRRETGRRGEARSCGEPRSIGSSRASAREARCVARAAARERSTLGGSRPKAFALNTIVYPRRDACAARKPR